MHGWIIMELLFLLIYGSNIIALNNPFFYYF
jgi:hypothetical protein